MYYNTYVNTHFVTFYSHIFLELFFENKQINNLVSVNNDLIHSIAVSSQHEYFWSFLLHTRLLHSFRRSRRNLKKKFSLEINLWEYTSSVHYLTTYIIYIYFFFINLYEMSNNKTAAAAYLCCWYGLRNTNIVYCNSRHFV